VAVFEPEDEPAVEDEDPFDVFVSLEPLSEDDDVDEDVPLSPEPFDDVFESVLSPDDEAVVELDAPRLSVL
jgi:hypothetical protein